MTEESTKCEPGPSGRRCKTHDFLPLYPDGTCSVGRVALASGLLGIVRYARTDLDESYRRLTIDELSDEGLSYLIRAKIKIDNAIRLIEDRLEKRT